MATRSTDDSLAAQYAAGSITLEELNAKAAEAGAAATTAPAAEHKRGDKLADVKLSG